MNLLKRNPYLSTYKKLTPEQRFHFSLGAEYVADWLTEYTAQLPADEDDLYPVLHELSYIDEKLRKKGE